MLVCVVAIKLHIFSVHSLKEKRSIIKSLKEKIKHKFNISVGEVGDHELWQSCELGMAIVGNNKGLLERVMEKMISFIEENGEVEIISLSHEVWSYHD